MTYPWTPERLAVIKPRGSFVLGAVRQRAAALLRRLAALHRLAAVGDDPEIVRAIAAADALGRQVTEQPDIAVANVEGSHATRRERMLLQLDAWGKLIDIGDRLDVICDLLPGSLPRDE